MRRAYARDWIRTNAEKAREAMRRWRRRHPEQHAAETRAYHARDRERWKKWQAAYNAAHPEIVRAGRANRRSREANAGGSFTGAEWRALLESFGHRCSYCGSGGPLHADHRVPLSRGGTNYIGNILPACARCNLRKHALIEEEFRARLEQERRSQGEG